MTVHVRYRAMLVAIAIASVANAQVSSALQQLEAFRLRPWIADTVTRAQQNHGKEDRAFPPRRAAPGVLTGTEGVTVESFRAAVRAGDHHAGFDSQILLLEQLDQASSISGRSSVFTYAGYVLAWCNLISDWARATLLSDKPSSDRLLQEIVDLEREVERISGGLEFNQYGSAFPTNWSEAEIRAAGLGIDMILTTTMDALQSDAGALTSSLDPEGYIRQRLLYVAESVRNNRHVIAGLADMAVLIRAELNQFSLPPPPPPPPRIP